MLQMQYRVVVRNELFKGPAGKSLRKALRPCYNGAQRYPCCAVNFILALHLAYKKCRTANE